MNPVKLILSAGIFIASSFFFTSCEKMNNDQLPPEIQNARGGGKGGGKGETSIGNNLSFPVIWAEGTTLALRQPPAGTAADGVKLGGAWWYVWGVDPSEPTDPVFSCQPSPSKQSSCFGGSNPGDGTPVYKAYLQKDANNYWRAYNAPASGTLNVDSVDWGDNLESHTFGLTSMIRTEVVLLKNLPSPVLQYAMRHVSGWGSNEMHGLQTTLDNIIQTGPGTQATVYSNHARLTIQKLTSTTPVIHWDATNHYWTGNGINAPIYNKAVYQAAEGPGYYSAEINIKGKVIYGYTWNAGQLNEGNGVYRLTFSLDPNGGGTTLNTFFDENTGVVTGSESEEGQAGAKAIVDAADNLTYIDITLGGNGGGGSGHGGGGWHGGR